MFFSFDPEDGFEFHYTAAQAQQRAENALEMERHAAHEDGWNDSVPEICWGEVKQQALAVLLPHGIVDYKLARPVTETEPIAQPKET